MTKRRRNTARSDAGKQSVYLPIAMLMELHGHALRLDRPISWVVRRCIASAWSQIKALPSQPQMKEERT